MIVSRCSLSVPVLALTVVLAACGKDSSSTTTPTTPGTSPSGITIAVDSASNLQSAVAGTAIHVVLHTTAAGGVAAPNQVITWVVTSDSGKIASTSTTTDATGMTTNDWTLGTKAGTNTLSASITGANITITATGIAGPLKSLMKVSADSMTVVASASASLVVRALDQYANPISGIVVTWAATGGVLTPAGPTMTGSTGDAVVTFTTGTKPATYAISATASGVSPVAFTLTGS